MAQVLWHLINNSIKYNVQSYTYIMLPLNCVTRRASHCPQNSTFVWFTDLKFLRILEHGIVIFG